MRPFILFIIGIALFVGAMMTVDWFPYQLPAAAIGGILIGISHRRAWIKFLKEWEDN